MSDNFKFVQAQSFTVAGAGAVIGDTEITLSSFKTIDGVALTMANFGTKGFCTLEPNSGTQEEQISFTGVTQNANGTATLTGVSNVLFISPYTESSGLAKTHAGGVVLVISNTAGFYNNFASRLDDETITQTWTFTQPNYPRMDNVAVFPTDPEQLVPKAYADSLTFAGAPNASTSVQGLVQENTVSELNAGTAVGTTGALLFPTPADLAASIYGLQLPNANQKAALASDQAPTASNLYITQKDEQRNVPIYGTDSVGTDAYAITVTPAVSSYAAGMVFYFQAGVANTGPATLAVGSGGAKALVKGYNTALVTGDILLHQIVQVAYNTTNDNWQIISPVANAQTDTTVFANNLGAIDGTGGLGISNDATFFIPFSTLADAQVNNMSVSCKVPAGVTAITAMTILCASSAASGNIVMTFSTSRAPVAGGAITLNSAVAQAAYAQSGTANQLSKISIPSGAFTTFNPVTAGDTIGIYIDRNGGDSGDTINTDLKVYGVQVTFS